MARVTVSDVENIAEVTEISDSKVQSFIDDANNIVNTRVKGELDDSLLSLVEKWLAAHLAVLNPEERTTSEEGIGRSEIVYEGRSGLGLEYTRYGQQVLAITPDHIFASSSGSNYTRTVHSSSGKKDLSDDDPNYESVN